MTILSIGCLQSPFRRSLDDLHVSSASQDPTLTLGIEEEFFLVDPDSRDVIAKPDPAIFETSSRAAGEHKAVAELLRSQIETNTRGCEYMAELRTALTQTRRLVVESAERHGARAMATSMHPFAEWSAQSPTPRERYRRFAMVYQESVRRFFVSGMHIHAGFGDQDSRIRVMTALRRYLPLLLALSTSSPFNAGRETGFKSYRLNLIGALPRTNLPPPLHSHADYEALVEDYRFLEFIEDGSELWWDVRPSARYPTIELRICDICPRIEDALCIAAVYACLIRYLLRQDASRSLPAEPPTELIAENRWLASRYGVLAFFGDTSVGGRLDIDDYAAQLIAALAEDAEALDCRAELMRVPQIIRDGTSADRQIDLFRLRRMEGDDEQTALRALVDQAVGETREGLH